MRLLQTVLGLSFAVLSMGPMDHSRRVPGEGCEPAAPVELLARVVSIQQDRGVASAVLEITVSPAVDLAAVHLRGRLQPAGAGLRDFDLPVGAVSRGYERTVRHLLRMEAGRDHEVFLTLHAGPAAGLPVTVTTWLPIRLDPALRPRDAGGVLEFRAQTASGEEP